MNWMAPDPVDRIMAVMDCAFEPRFGEAWTRRQVADALLLGNCHYGLIAADGSDCTLTTADPEGFYLSRAVLDEEELLLFAIAPACRRRGLGHRLLKRMLDDAANRGINRVFLEMREGNPAGALYAAHDFRRVGVRPGYYQTSDGERLNAISQERILG
jgi:ribosomal-protein-alanine N-acetyltransferase